MKIYFIFLCLLISSGLAKATTQMTTDQDKPSRLYVKTYNLVNNGSSQGYGYESGEVSTFNENMNFQDGTSGNYFIAGNYYYTGSYPYPGASTRIRHVSETINWPPSLWPSITGTEIATSYDSDSDASWPTNNPAWGDYNYTNSSISTNLNVNVGLSQEHCDINYSSVVYSFQDNIRRTAVTTMHLQTGGKATSRIRNLFGITAGAVQCYNPIFYYYDYLWNADMQIIYNASNAPSQSIAIGSYGNLNANGVKYLILPDNADVDVTPYVAGVNYYAFNISQHDVQTKADWQAVVQNDIDSNSGVKVENYAAANGFLTNRANIQAVYAFYQKLFTEQPTHFLWAGLGKLAGAPVYAGLSDAQYGGLSSFQQTMIQMNIDVMSDLAWQFEAYRKVGLNALEYVYSTDGTALNLDAINAWKTIDQGIQQNNLNSVINGNETLLQREQQIVLAPGYTTLGSMTGITSVMSILAKSPVPVPAGSDPSAYDFEAIVPGGNLATFSDRWTWITDPRFGIWVTWLGDVNASSDVSTPLTTRAATYALFPLY